ncbi:Hypothetical protein SRAE_1000211150 [Strongyloides ratti]|uniref:Uncharacterized protein n=1 Tax=Strongyloides ratti TaxID=34506 RepID=A0A090MWK7_STRRB|nr:Hypothetical protein SRAE_1000211150 [Strongyloides ratti]CEF63854.1 Hypothetical protein SRAE_1000211150 [Strongyloides ratti]
MVDSNICYCEHENVNQDCLYCRLLMEKNESSLQSDNNFLDKKMIGNVTKTLTIECYNNNFCCDIKKETKKYLERIFKNDNDSRSIIINKNNTFDENKNNYLIFQSFLKLLHFIIKEKIFNDVLETFNIISFYIKLLDKINLNVYLWRILFDGKNKIQKKEIILSNDIRLKYGLVDECFIKSIDLNGESFEEFIIINNLFSIQETICYHTKVKKFIIGGCQKTSYDDKVN